MSGKFSLSVKAEAVGAALRDAGGACAVAELRRATGYGSTTMSRALAELEAAGLVERVGGSRGTPRLTRAGLSRFANLGPVSAGAVVDTAAAVWPEEQGAFLRLFLSAVVARRHLGSACPHLGFVTVGEPRTGKTPLFEQACRLFGLDPVAHSRTPSQMSKGEIQGRRVAAGSTVRLEPAPYLAEPLVLFDEFDEAAPAERDLAMGLLLHGEFRHFVEGQPLTVACTPMIAANYPAARGDHFGFLAPKYRTKRNILLDVGAPGAIATALRSRLGAYYAQHPDGQLALEQLVPPSGVYPFGELYWPVLRDYLSPGRAADFPDERALDALALGRATLLGVTADDEVGLAIAGLFTFYDWYTCAATVPGLIDTTKPVPELVLDEAQTAMLDGRADGAALRSAIERAKAAAGERAGRVKAGRVARARVDDEVLRSRAGLASRLKSAAEALDRRHLRGATADVRAQADGLVEVLVKHRRRVEQLDNAERIAEERDAVASVLAEATVLAESEAERRRDEIDARKNAQSRERADALARRAAERERAARIKEAGKRQRERARHELSDVDQVVRELERLYKRVKTNTDEDVLKQLRALGLVTYRADPVVVEPPAPTRLGRFVQRHKTPPWPGHWYATDGTSHPGAPTQCPDLSTWGAATQTVIAPALREGQARGHALRAQLGLAPRKDRVTLPAPTQTTRAITAPSGLGSLAWTQYGIRT